MGNATSSALRADDPATPAPVPADDGPAFGSLASLGAPKKFKKKPVLVLDPEELEKAHMMFQDASAELLGEEVERPERSTPVLGLAPMDDDDAAHEDIGAPDDIEDVEEDEIPSAEAVLRMTGSRPAMEQADEADEANDALIAQQLEGLDFDHRIFPSLPLKSEEQVAAEEEAERTAAKAAAEPDDTAPVTRPVTEEDEAHGSAEDPVAAPQIELDIDEAPANPDVGPFEMQRQADAAQRSNGAEPVNPPSHAFPVNPLPEPEAELEAAPEPVAELDAAPEPMAELDAAPEPEDELEAVLEPEAELEPTPEPEAEQEAAPEPAAALEHEAEPQIEQPAAKSPFGDETFLEFPTQPLRFVPVAEEGELETVTETESVVETAADANDVADPDEETAAQAPLELDQPLEEDTVFNPAPIEEPTLEQEPEEEAPEAAPHSDFEWAMEEDFGEQAKAPLTRGPDVAPEPQEQLDSDPEPEQEPEGSYTEIDDEPVDGYAFMYAGNPRARTLHALAEGETNSLRAKLIREREKVLAELEAAQKTPSIWARFSSWLRGLFD